MTRRGVHPLASGNELRWQVIDGSGRGAIEARFAREPSPADAEETARFMLSLMPPKSRPAFAAAGNASDRPAALAAIDLWTTGGGRN